MGRSHEAPGAFASCCRHVFVVGGGTFTLVEVILMLCDGFGRTAQMPAMSGRRRTLTSDCLKILMHVSSDTFRCDTVVGKL